MARWLTTAVEIVGYVLIAVAAWLLDVRLGIFVAGAALVAIAYGMGRR